MNMTDSLPLPREMQMTVDAANNRYFRVMRAAIAELAITAPDVAMMLDSLLPGAIEDLPPSLAARLAIAEQRIEDLRAQITILATIAKDSERKSRFIAERN